MTEKERDPVRYYAARYWIGRLGRPAHAVLDALLQVFSGPEEAWEESEKALLRSVRFGKGTLSDRFYQAEFREESLRVCSTALRKGMRLLCPEDSDYPALLKESSGKPLLLFCLGQTEKLNASRAMLGVVGARNCTAYGRSVTKSLCAALAPYGIAVVSGLARGIDAAAHSAALENGMFTAAVLGCGADVIYPAENAGIYRRIKEHGVILSEYPPGTTPFKSNFPARNRIIAGMSECVLVSEAGLGSGALITAGLALDEGRDVLAVPADIDRASGSGCNMLLKNGAGCVTSYRDILSALRIDTEKAEAGDTEIAGLSERERKIFLLLKKEPGDCDLLAEAAGMNVSEVRKILTMLEINGYIKRRSDGVYYAGQRP